LVENTRPIFFSQFVATAGRHELAENENKNIATKRKSRWDVEQVLQKPILAEKTLKK
jgi:hypothetical protein